MTDTELLTAFASGDFPQAFAVLVDRYIHLVYSAALRRTRDRHLADDVTQAVFIVLYRKAGQIRCGKILPAWLLNATRYAASNCLRLESRRRHHETEAAAMNPITVKIEPDVSESFSRATTSVLDDAMAQLHPLDRSALALRYFQAMSLRDIAAQLGLSEQATQKRVGRALEKLRQKLRTRGVTTPADALETTLADSVSLAPTALAPAILSCLHSSTATLGNTFAARIAKATSKSLWIVHAKIFSSAVAAMLLLTASAVVLVSDSARPAHAADAPAPVAAKAQVGAAEKSSSAFVLALPNNTFTDFHAAPGFKLGPAPDAKRTVQDPLLLQSTSPKQTIDAGPHRNVDVAPFRGKRVRFSAFVKSEALTNGAGLILVVPSDASKWLVMDFMADRLVTGTSDWTKLEIVADIPIDAPHLGVGFHLTGAGKAWFDDARIEIVDNQTPTTDDQNWHLLSPIAKQYTVAADSKTLRDGHPTNRISAAAGIPKSSTGRYSFMNRNPNDLVGKRVRFSVWVKCDANVGSPQLTMRSWKATGPHTDSVAPILRFPFSPKTDWQFVETIAEIPADSFAFEASLTFSDAGTIWIDDIKFESALER